MGKLIAFPGERKELKWRQITQNVLPQMFASVDAFGDVKLWMIYYIPCRSSLWSGCAGSSCFG